MPTSDSPGSPRKRTLPLPAIAAIALVIVVVIVFMFFWPSADSDIDREGPAPVAVPTAPNGMAPNTGPTGAGRATERATPPPAFQPEPPAPTMLEDPASFVAEWGQRVSAGFSGPWTQTPDMLARFVTATNSVVHGENPARHLAFLRPAGRFQVEEGSEGRVYIGPVTRARYRGLISTLDAVDVQQAAEAFRLAEPYLDRQYRTLGYPDGSFRVAALESIRVLLDTPEINGPIELVPSGVNYKYADEELEALEPAQRVLLRLSASDRKMIREKLEALERAITALPS